MFADSFKKLRIRSGLTQEELAEKLGKAKSTISMYENGNREPDYEMLPDYNGDFNVYINSKLPDQKQKEAVEHEIKHI